MCFSKCLSQTQISSWTGISAAAFVHFTPNILHSRHLFCAQISEMIGFLMWHENRIIWCILFDSSCKNYHMDFFPQIFILVSKLFFIRERILPVVVVFFLLLSNIFWSFTSGLTYLLFFPLVSNTFVVLHQSMHTPNVGNVSGDHGPPGPRRLVQTESNMWFILQTC